MNSETDPDILIVSDEEANQRLDLLLVKRYGGSFSRTYFQMLIDQGAVLLNGEPVKKRIKPSAGDEIEVEMVLTPEIDLLPEPIPLDILYEDEHVLAINKPAGMVVHPAPGNWTGTFVNGLLYHCQLEMQGDKTLRPGIVHRLDKDTTGVLIAAKTIIAHQKLVAAFAAREVHKEYLAISIGNAGKVTVDAPIGRHPVHRKQMAVIASGRRAVTHIHSLQVSDKWGIVRVILETGRTHQIRVHLKHLGTPILGDALYGNEQVNRKNHVSRQLLHAEKLKLRHPMTGELLEIIAPIPLDMQKWIDKIVNPS